jgi:hypothetical protein
VVGSHFHFGAVDAAAGGERIERIHRTDPDQPDRLSPLARPGVGVNEGDVIQSINGVPAHRQ